MSPLRIVTVTGQ